MTNRYITMFQCLPRLAIHEPLRGMSVELVVMEDTRLSDYTDMSQADVLAEDDNTNGKFYNRTLRVLAPSHHMIDDFWQSDVYLYHIYRVYQELFWLNIVCPEVLMHGSRLDEISKVWEQLFPETRQWYDCFNNGSYHTVTCKVPRVLRHRYEHPEDKLKMMRQLIGEVCFSYACPFPSNGDRTHKRTFICTTEESAILMGLGLNNDPVLYYQLIS